MSAAGRILRARLGTAFRLSLSTLLTLVVVLAGAELLARLQGGEPVVLGHLRLSELPAEYADWYTVTRSIDAAQFVMRAPYTYTALRPAASADPPGIHHDSLGLRGPEIAPRKPAATFRVLILGGSVAWGMDATGDDTTFWGILGSELQRAHPNQHVEVLSAATSGWNSTQELIDLRLRLIDLQPDLVIVFDGFNDYSQPLAGYVDNAPLGFREFIDLTSYAIDQPLHYWLDTTVNNVVLHSHSRLLNKLVVRSPAKVVHNLAGEIATPRWEQADLLLGPLIDRYLDNLAGMAQTAREHSFRILLVTQPDLYVARTPVGLERDLLDGGVLAQRAAERFHREVAARAPTVVDGQTSWYLDYTPVFESFDEPTYWDTVHPVKNGHRRIADALFRDVERLGLTP